MWLGLGWQVGKQAKSPILTVSLASTLANRLRPCKFCVGFDSRALILGALKRRGFIACDTHFRAVKNSLEFTLRRFVSERYGA